jgi:hypothetical protein
MPLGTGIDVASGVRRDLAGISPGQAGLGSGGAAQVGLVPFNDDSQAHAYEPSGSRDGDITGQVDRGKE